jgi:hypothetical protein
LHTAGQEQYLPLGLLARASHHRYALGLGHRADPDAGQPNSAAVSSPAPTLSSALADLQAVHDIAQRSGMRLHLTNYHLETARLALTLDIEVHEHSADQHLAQARELIAATGYKRRLPELEYLEKILNADS